MLFNVCSCVGSSPLAVGLGPLCAGGAGFVTAMMATLAASARTQPAKTLRAAVPVAVSKVQVDVSCVPFQAAEPLVL